MSFNEENNKFSILASVVIVVFALVFSFSVYQNSAPVQGQGGACLAICEWPECGFASEAECQTFVDECYDGSEDCPDRCLFNSECSNNGWEPCLAGELGCDGGGGGEGGESCEIRGWAWGESSSE